MISTLSTPRPKPTFSVKQPAERLQAEESIRSYVRDEVQMQQAPNENDLLVRKNAQSLFLSADGEARGTVVLYHGFTASPWQYNEMAEKLQDEGFNVFAPRMPGHGMADESGKASYKEMPTTREQNAWNDFANNTYRQAADLGVPVHAVGLSGGANVALKLAEQNPEVESVTAIAPFLGAGATGVLFPVLSAIDMVTFGLFGSLLDRIPRKRKPSPEETPRTQGTWGNALAMYRVGSSVKKVDAPLQAVTTEADPLSGKPQVAKLLKNSSNGQNIGWYHFSAEDKVQHAMVSPQENKNEDSVDLVRQIVSNMVGTGIPTSNHEVPAPSKTAKPLQFAPALSQD